MLGNIRRQGLEKLAQMPLGDVRAKGSGELKNILVERVDSMEPTLAHVLPEMSSNAVATLAALLYLFCLDWRMAFAALLTLPAGMVFFALMMAGYEKNYARTVAATKTLNDTAVEYIGGIEVIKVFGKAKKQLRKVCCCRTGVCPKLHRLDEEKQLLLYLRHEHYARHSAHRSAHRRSADEKRNAGTGKIYSYRDPFPGTYYAAYRLYEVHR